MGYERVGTWRQFLHWGPMLALGVISTISWMATRCHIMWWPPLQSLGGFLDIIVFFMWVGLTLYNYFCACLKGPGVVPLEWTPPAIEDTKYLQFCEVCKGYKVPRSHHCRKCGRCVMKMDHHCPWINTCCGHRNHASFIWFLFFAPIGCIHALFILIPSVYRALNFHYYYYKRPDEPLVYLGVWGFVVTMFAVGLSVGVIIAVGMLLFIQMKSVWKNETGIESWIIDKALDREEEEGMFVYPYNLGRKENLKQVFTWSGRPKSDGIVWDVVDGCHQYTLTIEQIFQKREKRERTMEFLIKESYSGYFFPISKGLKVGCCIPFTDEARIKLDTGDRVLVTRWKKRWLYGSKILSKEESNEKGGANRVRGWFPRQCAVEVIDGNKNDKKMVLGKKLYLVRPELAGEGSAPGWRRRPPQAIPSTPGADLDAPDFGLSRIKEKVVQSAMNREKRTVGMGILGNLTRRRFKSAVMTKDVKKQLSNLDDHRPYFTYWVTFVHVVVFIVSVAVYGIAPIGISTTEESADVRMPSLAIQRETHLERDNLWIGPRQADLIHLGAKYSPCMRKDDNLNKAIGYDRAEESESACCIRNDGSGCVQSVKSSCSNILSRWEKWSVSNPGPDGRTSGTVCGQDPEYCNNPSSTPPFEWKDEITEWPLCQSTAKPNQSLASTTDQHMSCEILGRPCCHGIQGECIITTREHCHLKHGFFHSDAFLCSQVHCMEEICGMIPFVNSDTPDQFYRLWTSLFLHGGLVHVVISVVFQMWIMRDLEKLMGAIRISIIFLGSGIAGNLASCTFIPYQVEAGPSGAHYGIAGCLLVEVLQSYQMYRKPWRAVLKILLPIIGFFVLGLFPWFDNWAHLFGFAFGSMLAFALVPYVSFGEFDKRRKMISIVVCLGLAIGIFTVLVLIFYVAPLTECSFCIYFNCIPLTADFCDNMAVDLNRNSTYSSHT